MARSPDQHLDNVDFAAQEIADAPEEERALMLDYIAKALTSRLLQDLKGIGAREISARVTRFLDAVRQRVKEIDSSRRGPQ